MFVRLARTLALAALAFAVSSTLAAAQPGARAHTPPPEVPATLEVPDGFRVFFTAHAIGTQNYICLPAPAGVAWKLVGPQATLYQAQRRGLGQQQATHYLSANPVENGLARPTWQHSFDSSKVWGRAVASSTDPNFVQAGAIPWLLVQVAGTEEGPTGGSFLTDAAFVQRINTAGGAAPATGCATTADVGALALVPYAADYVFFRETRGNR